MPKIRNDPHKDRYFTQKTLTDTIHTASHLHDWKSAESDKEGYWKKNLFIQLLHIIYPSKEHGEEPSLAQCILSLRAQSPLCLAVCVWILYYLDRERERDFWQDDSLNFV